MDGGAWQRKYINVNIQAYNDTKNKVKNEDNRNYPSDIQPLESILQRYLLHKHVITDMAADNYCSQI